MRFLINLIERVNLFLCCVRYKMIILKILLFMLLWFGILCFVDEFFVFNESLRFN